MYRKVERLTKATMTMLWICWVFVWGVVASFGVQAFQSRHTATGSQIKLPYHLLRASSDSLLPRKLNDAVQALKLVNDEQMRYRQLLFLASTAKPFPPGLRIPENKVPGCLSTVYVHAELDSDGAVQYLGDSDSQLTKGLVAFLVDGLSGSSAEDIQNVDPGFIKEAGIAQSLTPGRNNGFLNMLALMKRKAAALQGLPT